MESTTLTKERTSARSKVPVAHPESARTRDLTPAQRRAVMFAQQQVLRARAVKKAKDERQAALTHARNREEDAYTHDAMPHEPVTHADQTERVAAETKEVSLREAIGHVLRELRTNDHKTLREVSEKAGVSLGYLSEVERGQKEASSELLISISKSLGLTSSQMLRRVADYMDEMAA